MSKIRPTLWFDTQAEEAARFYTSIFKNSRIGRTTRFPAVGQEVHGKPAGSVMTVEFELDGQPFLALNGGPEFTFNEAISLEIRCSSQDEIDYFWDRLSEGGDPSAQQCGWLKDKFGVSWQVGLPEEIDRLLSAGNEGSERAFKAMLEMKKLDISALEAAYEGKAATVRAGS